MRCRLADPEYQAVHRERSRDTMRRLLADPDYRKRNAERNRAARTGITPYLFESLVLLQDGKCGVCSRPLERPHADHCHDTGKPRGLLCHHCNAAEGMIRAVGLTPGGFAQRLEAYLRNPPARDAELV
jgi:hypothetical protein